VLRFRAFCVIFHRWAGLTMAGFLLVAGLTGGVLVWTDELEALLDPALILAAPPSPQARPLDPIALHRAAQAHVPPGKRADWIALAVEPGRSVRFGLVGPGRHIDLFLNPYTGEVLGKRIWADLSQGQRGLMSFVYELHYALALDRAGVLLMGLAALLWTVDCFVGAYLTFPPVRRNFWRQWAKAWSVRMGGGSYKVNFALHRAGGLWLWAMLFVLAWSSVSFNLREAYDPVMRLVPAQAAAVNRSHLPRLARPRHDPALAHEAALAVGRRLMAEQAVLLGFTVEREDWLGYDPGRAVYTYMARTSRDIRERHGGNTRLYLDADSGAFKGIFLPTGEAVGDTFTSWITTLHMAAIWGVPFRLFMTIMGLAVAVLSVTGIVIWWKKLKGRRARRTATVLPINTDATSPDTSPAE
jgi:uncharacterized iron-regulated membrane protein